MTDRIRSAPLLVAALIFSAVVPAAAGAQAGSQAATLDPTQMASALRFRYIGPVGNRIASVAGVPGDPNVYYAGAASGGIWKTTDARHSLVADLRRPESSRRSARSPSRRRTRTSSGRERASRGFEATSRSAMASTSRPTPAARGRTMGLDSTGRIGRIVIDPSNPDIVFVAAQGHSYGPQQERGIYRTTDGGTDVAAGAVRRREHRRASTSSCIRPTRKTLFAAMWQLEMHTWGRESGGPGSGIYTSHRRRHDLDASLRATGFRRTRSERSASRSRARIRIACTR